MTKNEIIAKINIQENNSQERKINSFENMKKEELNFLKIMKKQEMKKK